jgi:PadR family transcriptional regulator, regulatory protein PadR
LCEAGHDGGGKLEQIPFLLVHASVQTTECYLGCQQNLGHPALTLLDNLGEQNYGSPRHAEREIVRKQVDLLQGTLDMLILKAISLGPLHGYGVLLRIQQISGQRLEIQQGSLYPALYRLEHQGLIASAWGESENKRKAKFYRLTASGRRQLHSASERWNEMTSVVGSILRVTPEEV